MKEHLHFSFILTCKFLMLMDYLTICFYYFTLTLLKNLTQIK